MLAVSTHAGIWLTTYYSTNKCQARVHANEACEMYGQNMRAHANQNAGVQFVQTNNARALFVQTMMRMTAD